MLRLPERPTALFMANDLMALGAYQAAAEVGLSIPEDVSVVGVDDVYFTRFLAPPLTTVHVPTRQAGYVGIKLLLENPQVGTEPQRVVLPTKLIIRKSTSPPSRLSEDYITKLDVTKGATT